MNKYIYFLPAIISIISIVRVIFNKQQPIFNNKVISIFIFSIIIISSVLLGILAWNE